MLDELSYRCRKILHQSENNQLHKEKMVRQSFFRQVGEIYQGLLAGSDWPALRCCDKERLVRRSTVWKIFLKVIFPPCSTLSWPQQQYWVQHPRKNRDQLETSLKRAVRVITGQANTCYKKLRLFNQKRRLGEERVCLKSSLSFGEEGNYLLFIHIVAKTGNKKIRLQ